ncbi:unnamed protein product [Durusdinium trenchii]|uniref:C2H2-type domain-containing protein n=1 Tax=Durusdinium trenchii TaxID=1381693 RepID=A0ABP0I8E2_9DINO
MISSFFSSLDSLGLAAPSSDAAFPTVPPGWGPSFFDCSDCSDSDFCSTGRLATHGLGQHSWTFAPRKNHADASLQACQKGRDHRSSFPFGQSIDRCSPLGPLRFLVVAFDRGPSAKRIAKSAKFSTGEHRKNGRHRCRGRQADQLLGRLRLLREQAPLYAEGVVNSMPYGSDVGKIEDTELVERPETEAACTQVQGPVAWLPVPWQRYLDAPRWVFL